LASPGDYWPAKSSFDLLWIDRRALSVKVKYRMNDPRLAPRRTRLEIPGWADTREPRANSRASRCGIACRFSEKGVIGVTRSVELPLNKKTGPGRIPFYSVT
jgi:hypothetical protein